jgi:hypothetical protein
MALFAAWRLLADPPAPGAIDRRHHNAWELISSLGRPLCSAGVAADGLLQQADFIGGWTGPEWQSAL